MIFKNSQDDIVFDETTIPLTISKIGIKISGGADSAIVCYMLAKYLKEERPDAEIFPITGISDTRPYNKIFTERIIRKITDLTGFNFSKHYSMQVKTDSSKNYIDGQQELVNHATEQEGITCNVSGITCNPTKEDAPNLFSGKMLTKAPTDNRTRSIIKKEQFVFDGSKLLMKPLVNTDKKGVAEHYINNNVLEELFPLTRSCELRTHDFTKHCGECWFCQERLWGFGKLD